MYDPQTGKCYSIEGMNLNETPCTMEELQQYHLANLETGGGPLQNLVDMFQPNQTIDTAALSQAATSYGSQVINAITDDLRKAGFACLNACGDTIGVCQGCFEAAAETEWKKTQQLVEKLGGKVGKDAIDSFATTMTMLAKLGLGTPPPEMIQAIISGVPADAAIQELLKQLESPEQQQAEDQGLIPPGGELTGVGPNDDPGGVGSQITCGLHGGKYDSATKRCLSPCPDNFGFNETTKECLPLQTQTTTPPTQPPQPPPPKVCIEGTVYDPVADDCIQPCIPDTVTGKLPPGCDVGQPQGGSVGSVVMKDGVCCIEPGPSHLVESCEVKIPIPQPPYWTVCSTDKCGSARVDVYQGYIPPTVPTGGTLGGPFGTKPNCESVVCSAITVCPPSSGTGGSTPPPPPPPPHEPPSCPPNTHWDTTLGQCVPDIGCPQQDCPSGFHWDDKACKCVADECIQQVCPDGMAWDNNQCKCISIVPQPPPNTSDLTSCDVDKLVELWTYGKSAPSSPTDLPPPGQVVDESGFFAGLWSILNPSVSTKDFIDTIMSAVFSGVNKGLEHSPCRVGPYLTYVREGLLLNSFGGWLGAMPKAPPKANEYLQNLACQYLLPDAGTATALRAKRILTDDQWKAAVAANGVCIPWEQKSLDASYVTPGISEATALYRRNAIDAGQWIDLLERAGVKDNDTAAQYYALSDFIPGPGDIVSFMLRDVADPAVVTEFKLDDEFDDKFTGRLPQWAMSAGIDTETMRYYWRAHWTWPSNEQLYTMLHRLRDDTPVPGSNEVATKVTIDDVLKVLGINDISPAWRTRLAAVSYRVPMRRELAKMYEVGAITKAELSGRFQDLGYTEADARTLSDYLVKDSAGRKAAFDGVTSQKEVLQLYLADGLNYQQALDMLLDAGVDVDAAPKLLDTADRKRNAKDQAANVRALKRRFMVGDLSTNDVVNRLSGYGVVVDRVAQVVTQWQEELSLKRKEPTVANLCDWATRGYIQADEYMRRLMNLGYTAADANNFIQSCAFKANEQLAKKVEQAANKAKRQAKEDSKCRIPPKPYCFPKRVQTSQDKSVTTNGKGTVQTHTDTDTTSSG